MDDFFSSDDSSDLENSSGGDIADLLNSAASLGTTALLSSIGPQSIAPINLPSPNYGTVATTPGVSAGIFGSSSSSSLIWAIALGLGAVLVYKAIK